jgi:hypothetical protein
VDLLTPEEEALDARKACFRFDVDLLVLRLTDVTDRLAQLPEARDLPVGYFAAGTAATAALVAAAERPGVVAGVVACEGRPDLAGKALARLSAATLLVVGDNDEPLMAPNRAAVRQVGASAKELLLLPGVARVFDEPDSLEEVARRTAEWFTRYLGKAR